MLFEFEINRLNFNGFPGLMYKFINFIFLKLFYIKQIINKNNFTNLYVFILNFLYNYLYNRNMTQDRKNMIIGEFMLIRILVYEVIFKFDE